MVTDNGKYIFGVVKVGDRGQIVIPKGPRGLWNQGWRQPSGAWRHERHGRHQDRDFSGQNR